MAENYRPALRWSDDGEGRRRSRVAARASGRPVQDEEAQPSKLTEEALREAALRYLDRQDACVEQVRRVLRRRHARYGKAHDKEVTYLRIESVLDRFVGSRLLDDERYALALADSVRRRGGSIPKVRQKLVSRGLSREFVELGISSLAEHPELNDEESAKVYARKRRLRSKYDLSDPAQRGKALATLARQGFSFDVARSALGL